MPHLQLPPPSFPLLLPISSLSLSRIPPSPLVPQAGFFEALRRAVLCLTNEWMELLLHKEGEEFVYSC